MQKLRTAAAVLSFMEIAGNEMFHRRPVFRLVKTELQAKVNGRRLTAKPKLFYGGC